MTHELLKLDYPYGSLEPFIDSLTMEIHHSKHLQTYVNNLNKALETFPELAELSLSQLMEKLPDLNGDGAQAVKNNAGGVYNHNFFFSLLQINNGEGPKSELITEINEKFGSFDTFKEQFNKEALGRFGSGWAWLVVNKNGKLEIMTTANQDSPISQGLKPILALDVWEHAYYLKYQNRRSEYIENWWKVVNWNKVLELYQENV